MYHYVTAFHALKKNMEVGVPMLRKAQYVV